MFPSLECSDDSAQCLPHSEQGIPLPSGSHDNRTGEPLAVYGQILPQQERPHTVAEQDIWHVRVLFLCNLPQLMDVSDDIFISFGRIKITVFLFFIDGLPVTEMIVSCHVYPVFRQIIGKSAVSFDIFHHPVAYLNDSFYLPIRYPFCRVDLGQAVARRIIKIFFHSYISCFT